MTVTYKESDLLLGDADGNGEVNNADAVAVLRHLVDNTPSNFVPENADVNQDGTIDNRKTKEDKRRQRKTKEDKGR